MWVLQGAACGWSLKSSINKTGGRYEFECVRCLPPNSYVIGTHELFFIPQITSLNNSHSLALTLTARTKRCADSNARVGPMMRIWSQSSTKPISLGVSSETFSPRTMTSGFTMPLIPPAHAPWESTRRNSLSPYNPTQTGQAAYQNDRYSNVRFHPSSITERGAPSALVSEHSFF